MKTKSLIRLNIFFIIFSILLILAKWSELPPQVPLFYRRPWGEDQLAEKYFLFLLPFISLAVFLTNRIMGNQFTAKGLDFFAQASSLISFTVSALCLISLWKIIFLIT
jgi:hypothetical protein